MEPFTFDALTIEPVQGDVAALRLRWRGRSQSRHPSTALGPYLSMAIGQALDTAGALELRFDEVEYFNSATVTAIVQCIHMARARGVRLRLVYDDALEWQRLSFDAMAMFTGDGSVELCGIHSNGVGETTGRES